MDMDKIKEALTLAEKLRRIFVATADSKGLPHIAAAGKLLLNPDSTIAVTSWFCPTTVANLQENKQISLVIWDKDQDRGFQLLGEVKDMLELGVLDGFAPEIELKSILPQVQRQLLVEVKKVIEFKHAPHSDT